MRSEPNPAANRIEEKLSDLLVELSKTHDDANPATLSSIERLRPVVLEELDRWRGRFGWAVTE